MRIDLNCDMGESFGAYRLGNDLAIMRYVSSANIACGFHAGDAHVMRATVAAAAANNVAIGAHPSLPDLQGFGRRAMAISANEVYDIVLYQIGALAAFARAQGASLRHVKAHGALYNMAAKDSALAQAIGQATFDFDRNLVLYGLAGSELIRAAQKIGLPCANEVFADRTYQDDGSLTPRSQPNAIIDDIGVAVAQVLQMVRQGTVRSVSGNIVAVQADTLCIHGDQANALVFAQRIRTELQQANVEVLTPRNEK